MFKIVIDEVEHNAHLGFILRNSESLFERRKLVNLLVEIRVTHLFEYIILKITCFAQYKEFTTEEIGITLDSMFG